MNINLTVQSSKSKRVKIDLIAKEITSFISSSFNFKFANIDSKKS